jgi:hypothetical protein
MAIILPLVMFMGIGLCVIELAVFRYHQVAYLTHESARYASVHGKNVGEGWDVIFALGTDKCEVV